MTAEVGVSEVFLTIGELAQLLKVSERTIKRWTAEGLLPCVRPAGYGGAVRYRLREVLDGSAIDAGLRLVGEMEQARANPLCPRCGKRECIGTDLCGPCQTERRERAETSAELERARKRRNWERHGQKYRETQRRKREGEQ